MSDYDSKLGEWLKYVQQQVDSAAKPGEEKPEEQAKPKETVEAAGQTGLPLDVPQDVISRDRLGRIPASDAADIDPRNIVGDFSLIEDRAPAIDNSPALFDDDEIPNVEDFLPFLKDKEETRPKPPAMPQKPAASDSLNHLPEGTGEPKPVVRPAAKEPRAPETPVVRAEPIAPQAPPAPAPVVEQPAAKAEPAAKPAEPKQTPAPAQTGDVTEMWNQLPRHIQVLAGTQPEEVAQNSYKQFKETRTQLIARLLDPEISLEEAARVLNVCPTTVRRYTNRGVLKHHRTGGNQRRFRLSDVLAFLEVNTGATASQQSNEA
jgi:excisionase family DNA binding protein